MDAGLGEISSVGTMTPERDTGGQRRPMWCKFTKNHHVYHCKLVVYGELTLHSTKSWSPSTDGSEIVSCGRTIIVIQIVTK